MIKIDSRKKLHAYFDSEFSKIRNSGTQKRKASKYFGEIGSTQIEDIEYTSQLEVKISALKNIFQDNLTKDPLANYEIVGSPNQEQYRFRMDYVAAHNPIHPPHDRFGQRKKGNFSWVVDMTSDNLVKKTWFEKTRQIYKLLNKSTSNYDLKTHIGYLRYLVLRIHENEAMLTIVTASDEHKATVSAAAKEALSLGFTSIYWQVNDTVRDESSGKTVQFWGAEYMKINLKLKNQSYEFLIGPDNFFQNNIPLFEILMSDLYDYIETEKEVLLDLYCGVGTIGILLSKKFQKLIGYELVSDSIKLAHKNALVNNVENFKFIEADLNDYDFTSDVKSFENLSVVVDPPRTGLTEKGVELIKKLNADTIYYISCNPITQMQDLELLKGIYEVEFAKAYDMFPHTYHIENLVVLRKI